MRRSFVLLPATLLGLLLLAAPALAAEETAAADDNLALGMILALILGSIMGLIVFVDANSGTTDEVPSPPREH